MTLCAFGRDRLDTGRDMADRNGIAYTTAFRMREKLRGELRRDPSLLVSSICIEDLCPPQDVVDDEFRFLMWLLDSCASREQQTREG
ncbi:hypothetical protein IMCC21224_113079 [Puniceibacterium sp. IMCC21224]|nr:hypothetical protein IMCC21224_113079 [Puniceibacterium sp. IMCC21224]